jgi:hypothetical protein
MYKEIHKAQGKITCILFVAWRGGRGLLETLYIENDILNWNGNYSIEILKSGYSAYQIYKTSNISDFYFKKEPISLGCWTLKDRCPVLDTNQLSYNTGQIAKYYKQQQQQKGIINQTQAVDAFPELGTACPKFQFSSFNFNFIHLNC